MSFPSRSQITSNTSLQILSLKMSTSLKSVFSQFEANAVEIDESLKVYKSERIDAAIRQKNAVEAYEQEMKDIDELEGLERELGE